MSEREPFRTVPGAMAARRQRLDRSATAPPAASVLAELLDLWRRASAADRVEFLALVTTDARER